MIKPKLKMVSARLYQGDIAELKRRAVIEGTSWHFLLREALHRGIGDHKKEIR